MKEITSNSPDRARTSPAGILTRLICLAFASAMLTCLVPAQAASITIPNPGFEAYQPASRTNGVDQFTEWSNTRDVWRHWTRTENGGPVRIWNPGPSGVVNPGAQSSFFYGFSGTAPEGNMVAVVRSQYSDIPTSSVLVPPQWDGVNYFSAACLLLDGTIGSPLAPATSFDPTKVYTLTATVGKPKIWASSYTNGQPVFSTDPNRPPAAVWHGYALQLAVGGANVGGSSYAGSVSGGAIVAQDSNSRVVTLDGYRTVTTTYFPNPADAGLTGQNLQLRLAALDNPADFKMTGYVMFDDVKIEEFAAPTTAYWDLNGTDPGTGSATPTGTWDATNSFWNNTSDGTGTTNVWTAGQTAVFAAGGDATNSYTVTVDGTQDIGGLAFEEGTVTLTGGTALRLTQIAMVDVTNGLTATIATPITEATTGLQLAKIGTGTLVLSGSNTYSGGTTVLEGNLNLGANNVLDDASPVTLSGWLAGTNTLDLAGNSDTIGGLVLGGTTTSTAAAVTTSAGTLTLGGDVAYVNASGTGVNPLGATISGNLDLGAAPRSFVVNNSATAADDLTISANITGSVAMSKVGKGTLVLSGSNAGATGGMSLEEGVTRFESTNAINGTTRNVTVATPGTVVLSSSFGAGNIPTALASRIVESSDGILAADNYAATSFDFNTPGLTNIFLGAVSDLTYTGTLTPASTGYRIGGGGGTLTLANTNALTGGGNSLSVGGKVNLTAANNHGGGTVLLGGTVFPAGPVILTLGDNGSLGTGPLTIQAATNASTTGTLQSSDSSTRTLANTIVLNGGLNVAGTGNFSFTDTTPIALTATRLFVIGNPVTSFAQAFTGTGGITMDYTGPGTLILTNNNSYNGVTTVNGGTLVLTGNNSAATNVVSLSSRFGVPVRLVIGHDNALGGTLSIGGAPVAIEPQGTRTITNPVTWGGSFAVVGTNALTLTGLMTMNNNHTMTNDNVTTTTTLANITGANRNATFSGDGNTVVTGNITTGTGQLIKNGAGTLTLTGTNTYTGVNTINAGTLRVGNGGTSGTLGGGNVTINSQLVFNRSDTLTVTNVILGAGSLSQDGAGTLILTRASPSFSGATTVNAGTLLVNSPGLLGTTTLTVNSNTTFGGNGTVSGSVQVADGGNLTPGTSAGTLTVGSLDVSAMAAGGTGKLNFELDALAGTNDQIVVNSSIFTIGTDVLGFNDFAFTNLGGLEIGTYTLVTSVAGISGTLDPANTNGLIGSFTGALQINGNNLELVVGSSTPASALLTNSFDGTTLSLSWPAGEGWRLEYQTNALSVGLATNWMEAADSSVSATNITVDPSQPATFYRLIYP